MAEVIGVPAPEPPDELKMKDFATEIAFNALITSAQQQGMKISPVMGLMYLPDQALTRQFQRACRDVLASLKNEV